MSIIQFSLSVDAVWKTKTSPLTLSLELKFPDCLLLLLPAVDDCQRSISSLYERLESTSTGHLWQLSVSVCVSHFISTQRWNKLLPQHHYIMIFFPVAHRASFFFTFTLFD